MKLKIYYLFCLLASVFILNAQTTGIYADILSSPDASQVTINLYLNDSEAQFTALEAYISLPEGITNFSQGSLADAASATHSITEGIVDGKLFISISDANLAQLPSSADIPLCSWQCNLSSLHLGKHTIALTDLLGVALQQDDTLTATFYNDQLHTIEISSGTITSINNLTINPTQSIIHTIHGFRINKPISGQINIINGQKIYIKH